MTQFLRFTSVRADSVRALCAGLVALAASACAPARAPTETLALDLSAIRRASYAMSGSSCLFISVTAADIPNSAPTENDLGLGITSQFVHESASSVTLEIPVGARRSIEVYLFDTGGVCPLGTDASAHFRSRGPATVCASSEGLYAVASTLADIQGSQSISLHLQDPITVADELDTALLCSGGVTPPAATEAIVQLASHPSANHTCARGAGGSVWCWGLGSSYQIGDGSAAQRNSPVRVALGEAASEIAVGTNHTCATGKNSGTVYCWGSNAFHQLSIVDPSASPVPGFYTVPAAIPNGALSSPLGLSLGANFTCLLTGSKTAYCAGQNSSSELGDGTTGDKDGGVGVLFPTTPGNIVKLASGPHHSCILDSAGTGSLQCWGNVTGANGPVPKPAPSPLVDGALALGVGGDHTCVVRSNGSRIDCMGNNSSHQLGGGCATAGPCALGTAYDFAAVGKVVTDLSLGGAHSCALLNDKTLGCWGKSDQGELGQSTGVSTTWTTPLGVYSNPDGRLAGVLLNEVTQVASGQNHNCAIRSDGTVWCWGANTLGQLGIGTAGATPVIGAVEVTF